MSWKWFRSSRSWTSFFGKHGHFIDGASSQVDSSERLSVLDPSTGNEIAGVANGGIQSVNAAVEAARRSLNGEWGAMRPADRERLLHNFSSVIEAYAEELAQLETINQGKSIHSGYRGRWIC